MSEKYQYKQGDRIWFTLGDAPLPSGFAKVVGCSSEPIPPLGRQWIVELEEPRTIDPKVYPFTHIAVFDIQIKEPPKS